jgi:hypothetical protein
MRGTTLLSNRSLTTRGRFLHGNRLTGVVPHIRANLTTCKLVLASLPGARLCGLRCCVTVTVLVRQLFQHIGDAGLHAVGW